MGKTDFLIFIHPFDYGENILTDPETISGMRDSGNGNRVNGNEGDDSASDVHETAKGLQMGYPGWNNISGAQFCQVFSPAFFLDLPSGKDGDIRSGRILADFGNSEADGFVYLGNNGDIPGSAFLNADGALVFGDNAFHTA